ncbi:MAG: ketol-acid reductoisomerase, partial [Planctomycetota bacterium]
MSDGSVRVFRESDIDTKRLDGKTVAVVGYGSQGRGQSLNLRDSGLNVVLGLREGGATWNQATADGWTPLPIGEAVAQADMTCILIPDMAQKKAYEDHIAPNLKQGSTLLFSHGLAIVYDLITPPADSDVVMIAPKGPGGLVRREYEKGGGVPGLVAVHQ